MEEEIEFIVSTLIPMTVTATILLGGLFVALLVGKISGKLLRKILDIGG
ncbi:MAG: hypothetical protein ACO2OY_04495 [Thermodesulfobacteriaceae bacterium]